jgi:hypothetical protein
MVHHVHTKDCFVSEYTSKYIPTEIGGIPIEVNATNLNCYLKCGFPNSHDSPELMTPTLVKFGHTKTANNIFPDSQAAVVNLEAKNRVKKSALQYNQWLRGKNVEIKKNMDIKKKWLNLKNYNAHDFVNNNRTANVAGDAVVSFKMKPKDGLYSRSPGKSVLEKSTVSFGGICIKNSSSIGGKLDLMMRPQSGLTQNPQTSFTVTPKGYVNFSLNKDSKYFASTAKFMNQDPKYDSITERAPKNSKALKSFTHRGSTDKCYNNSSQAMRNR